MSKNYVISQTQLESLEKMIQSFIDSALKSIKEESDDWGMDQMESIRTIESIDSIIVKDVIPQSWGFIVNVVFILSEYGEIGLPSEYQDLRSEIQWKVKEWIPNVKIFIVDMRKLK